MTFCTRLMAANQIVNRGAAAWDTISQRFDGDIQTDLIEATPSAHQKAFIQRSAQIGARNAGALSPSSARVKCPICMDQSSCDCDVAAPAGRFVSLRQPSFRALAKARSLSRSLASFRCVYPCICLTPLPYRVGSKFYARREALLP